jgi:hypothetical protein
LPDVEREKEAEASLSFFLLFSAFRLCRCLFLGFYVRVQIRLGVHLGVGVLGLAVQGQLVARALQLAQELGRLLVVVQEGLAIQVQTVVGLLRGALHLASPLLGQDLLGLLLLGLLLVLLRATSGGIGDRGGLRGLGLGSGLRGGLLLSLRGGGLGSLLSLGLGGRLLGLLLALLGLRLRLGRTLLLQTEALIVELLLLAGQLAGGLLLPRQLAPQPLQVVHGGLLQVQTLLGQLPHQVRHILHGRLAAALGGCAGALGGDRGGRTGLLVSLAVGLRAVLHPLGVGRADLVLGDGVHSGLTVVRLHLLEGREARVALGRVEPEGGDLAAARGRHNLRLLVSRLSLLRHLPQDGENHLIHQQHVVIGGRLGRTILSGRLAAAALGRLQRLHQGRQGGVLGGEVGLHQVLHGQVSQGRHFWGLDRAQS